MKKTTTTKTAKKVLGVSTPVDYEKNGESKTAWTRVGTAFEGPKGLTVMLNALPVNGKLFISEMENASN